MALSPLPPCRKATKGRTIKVETVLVLSLRAEARSLLSHQATAKLSTTSTKQLETRSLTMHPGCGQAA
jgi:hypothetical protein